MKNPTEVHIEKFKENLLAVDGYELKNFLLNKLDSYYGRYRRRLKACIKDFSETSVHDLRVSIRKLNSIIKLVSKFDNSNYIPGIKSELKHIFSVLGRLRDVQVMILTTQNMRLVYPELNNFYYELLAEELNKLKYAQDFILKLDKNHLKQEIFFLSLDIKLHMNINEHNGYIFLELLKKAFKKVEMNIKDINKDDIESIHKMRISFKKFRYLFELSLPLGKLAKKEVKHLQHFQDLMGAVQDAQVLENKFLEFIANKSSLKQEVFSNVRSIINERLIDSVEVLMDRIDDIYHFNYFSELPSSQKDITFNSSREHDQSSSSINLIEGFSGKN